MNYSNNPGKVRLSRFKLSGKWYDDIELDMAEFYDEQDVNTAVLLSVRRQKINTEDFILVVLEPYHKNAYPVMLIGY